MAFLSKKSGSTGAKAAPAKAAPAKASSPSRKVLKDFTKFLKKTPRSPKKTAMINSKIQMSVMDGYVGAHITNLVPISRSPFTEKTLNDAYIKAKVGDTTFLTEYHPCVHDYNFFFHQGDIQQKHYEGSKWHIRYFVFELPLDLTMGSLKEVIEFLRSIAQIFMDHVNAQQRDGSALLTIPDDDSDFLYRPREDMVLSDVIGRDEAKRFLRNKIGFDNGSSFEEQKDYIHQIFRSGELPSDLQNFTGAPDEEVWHAYKD